MNARLALGVVGIAAGVWLLAAVVAGWLDHALTSGLAGLGSR